MSLRWSCKLSKIVDETVWLSPRRILWSVFFRGYTNIVIVGEKKDGTVDVYGSLGGKRSNSLMTQAIKQVKNG